MFKLINIILTLHLLTSLCTARKQAEFDAALDTYYKKVSGLKFPKNQSVDRTHMKSNMRKTSETAKLINDLYHFARDYALNNSASKRDLVGFTINSTYCPFQNQKIICDEKAKFRTFDGTCNNLKNPRIGAANTPYARFLPPIYDDGVDSTRNLALDGSVLPNVRTISLSVSRPTNVQRLMKNELTHLFPIFGQFLAHDLGASAATTDNLGNELECMCGSTDKNCIPITIPPQDPYLGYYCLNNGGNVGQANLTCVTNAISKVTCIRLTRSSATFPDFSCTPSYREQLNLYTAYIDGSAIYGSDDTRAAQLRTFSGGMLKTSDGSGTFSTIVPDQKLSSRKYLPLSNDTCSVSKAPSYKCFFAGEHRTSENIALVGVQLLFNREHNRIASELAKYNPTWDDQRLYQETRRIVVAELQHITFNEFVPQFVGNTSLNPLATNEYYKGYDPKANPQLTGEFSTAAFRMGHSLIRQISGRSDMNQTYNLTEAETPKFQNFYFSSYNVDDSLFKMDMAYNDKTQGLNSIVLGMLNDAAWKFGTLSMAMQNRLFSTTFANGTAYADGTTSAQDLLSINIQRGRDHGLQSYVKYLKTCLNIDIKSFDDLNNLGLMNAFSSQALKSVYKNVNDIDLYAGGLLETIVNDPLFTVGPTFGCILMEQFASIKKSDRFYYENGNDVNPYAFSLSQLAQIKSVTMAGLICNNFDLFRIQQNAFYMPNPTKNPFVNCQDLLKQIDFSKW